MPKPSRRRYRKKTPATAGQTAGQATVVTPAAARNGNNGNAGNGGKNNQRPQPQRAKTAAATASAAPADKNFQYLPSEKRSLWPSEILRSAAQPCRILQRNWRQELPHLFCVFFAVVFLYYLTTPHLVTLEDDGLFIANLEFFGVAHPPGYPVHTFLGGIFYHILPFGTPAFRGHFFSGFVGAIACAAIYTSIIMLVRGRVFGYLGGIGYGASKTFWSQAIITEVYTLNSMFFFIVLAMCIAYSANIGRSGWRHNRLLYILAFTYGVGMANHYPILFLGTTGLGLIVFSQLFKNILPNIFKAALFLLLGAAPPYLWMVWRSFYITPANFYGPIETFDQFLFYIRRSGYSGVDTQAGVGIEDKIVFGTQLADEMLWQYTPLGFLFIVIGVFVMLRSRYNWLSISLLASWFTSSVLLVFLLDFKASFIWLAAFRVYHLLAYGVMAIWLAVGAAWFVDKLRVIIPLFVARQQIAGALLLAVVGGSIYAHWEMNNRSNYRWAHDLAIAKINSVEANSVLFTFDDLDLPVGYLHYVEGVRPDLTVYNDQGLVYGNRLFSPLIGDHPPQGAPNTPNKAAILRDFIDKTPRPIFYHPQRRNLYKHPQYGSDFMGFLRRVNRSGPHDRVVLSDNLREWLNKNVHLGDEITDLWTRQQHYSTISQLVGAILLASLHGFELDDNWLEVIDRAREKNAQARMVTNSQYINAGQMSEDEMRRELEWARTYDIDSEELLDNRAKSSFFILRASMAGQLYGNDDPDYEWSLLAAMKRHPSKDNSALLSLIALYEGREDHCQIVALADRYYPDTDDIPDAVLRKIRLSRQKARGCPPPPQDEDSA